MPEPSPADEDRLLDIAISIADGTPVDWSLSRPDSPAANGFLFARLQWVEQLVRGHQAVRTSLSIPAQPGVRDTLLTEARHQSRAASSEPVRVQWGPLAVIEKIGRGSFGDVYRAWDPRLEREVALKLIAESASPADSPAIAEGRLLARVRHPNVLTVYGAERIDGRVGIWTEYIAGETLAHEVARRGPLAPAEAARIGIEVSRALGAVHAAGLLHRDVKAQNVLRDSTGRVVLSDFGTGVVFDEDTGVAEPAIAGTPLYLAPEVCERRAATIRSDLYGAGVLLYFLVTGTHPVGGSTFTEIRRAHAAGLRVPLRRARPDLPDGFVQIVETLLAPEPGDRYGDAVAVEQALDAWVASAEARPSRLSTRARPVLAISALSITVAIGAVLALASWRAQSPIGQAATGGVPDAGSTQVPLKFQARDWVLIAAFENKTGDALLDGTLEHALERELSNSSFVNVAPRERIEDVLQLMRKPQDSKVDARVGREIAVRDGAIRAVIAGRVERIGSAYVLTAQVVSPADGAVVATVAEEARAEADLLQAVRRQAFRMREALGETLRTIRESERALEKVTTPSLHAAQLYSDAAALMRNDGTWSVGPAETLLGQAVKEDPQFASAHVLLALSARGQGRPGREYLAHATRALALVDRTSDVERYFITGTYHMLRAQVAGGSDVPAADDDLRLATTAYEALLKIKPDHYWGIGFLAEAYDLRRQEPQAIEMLARHADLRPTNVTLRWSLAQRFFARGDWTRGWIQLRKAETLITPEFAREHPEYSAQISQLRIGEAWLRRDVTRVRALADELANRLALVDGTSTHALPIKVSLVGVYNAIGRLGDAQRVAATLPADLREAYLGTVLFTAANLGKPGGKNALLDYLKERYPKLDTLPPAPMWVAALVLLDRLDELRVAVAKAKRDGYVSSATTRLGPYAVGERIEWMVPAAEARLALAEGRIEDALRLFGEAAAIGGPPPIAGAGHVMVLAEAWVARGEVDRAIAMLESATRDRWATSAVTSNFAGFAIAVSNWTGCAERLAELYRAVGRHSEAEALDRELAALLVEAEDDYPMLVRLNARQR